MKLGHRFRFQSVMLHATHPDGAPSQRRNWDMGVDRNAQERVGAVEGVGVRCLRTHNTRLT